MFLRLTSLSLDLFANLQTVNFEGPMPMASRIRPPSYLFSLSRHSLAFSARRSAILSDGLRAWRTAPRYVACIIYRGIGIGHNHSYGPAAPLDARGSN